MVETVIKNSARRALSRRVRIDYELPIYLRSPIGVYIDSLAERKLITLVDITFSNGKHSETISAGYIFDGASIPRIFWGLKGFDPHGEKLWAALLHDWFCDKRAEYVVNREAAEAAVKRAASDEAKAAAELALQDLEFNAPLSLVVADAIFVSVLLDTGEVTARAIVMYLAVLGHHNFPRASWYLRRAVLAGSTASAGGLASAGLWWLIKNLVL